MIQPPWKCGSLTFAAALPGTRDLFGVSQYENARSVHYTLWLMSLRLVLARIPFRGSDVKRWFHGANNDIALPQLKVPTATIGCG